MAEYSQKHQDKVKKLTDKGFAHLDKGEYKKAIKVAGKLEKLKYSAAFDIAAQAYMKMDDFESAVQTLERGVQEAPDCWPNWQLLGNCLSDMKEYEKAENAFEKALTCTNAWEDSIRLNLAILANRRGNFDQAISHLNLVKDEKLQLEAAINRIRAMESLGLYDEAIQLGEDCLSKCSADETTEKYCDRIAAALGWARLGRGDLAADVRSFALDALGGGGSSAELLYLIREIDGRYSPGAKYFRLFVHITLTEDDPHVDELEGYFATYDIVEESEEQALELVREFESVLFTGPVKIEKAELVEPCPDQPLGVYWRSGRMFHGSDEDDDAED